MSPDECLKLSSTWDRKEMRAIRDVLLQGKTPKGWDKGKALEYLVLRAFEADKLEVTFPFNVAFAKQTVEQIDGSVVLSGIRFLLESKSGLSSSVDFTPIGKLHAQLSRRPATTLGIVFALNDFSPAAVDLADRTGPRVMLWHPGDLELGLEKKGAMRRVLDVKYARAQEYGVASFTGTELKDAL